MVTKASGGGGGRRGGRGGGAGGVRGGKVAKGGKGRGNSNPKYVSGSSQLIASSVCPGLVSNVAKLDMSRLPVQSPSGNVQTTPPPVVGSLSFPSALKAGGKFPFNNNVKVAEIELLEKFEGGLVTEQDGLAVMFEADADIEYRLTGTLEAHLSAWRQIDASTFALSVIENGYIPDLGPMPAFYSEANNKSYRENVDFANEAVMKLLKFGVVEEVQKSSLRCVNPLTVAQNTSKKRLCIDLSRCFNEQCVAQKFKIESTVQAMASIDPGDFMFSFDLKSAYLQVPVNRNFWPYLGFAIQTEGKSERYFWYKMLPFGLNDAARVLTKLMRCPIKHWRAQGISVFLHIDDGFSFADSREVALKNSAIVRADLIALGLLISEEKCSWGARSKLEWTGFIWDTSLFQLFVTEKKLAKAEALIFELKSSTGPVGIRQVAGLVGLLGSFYLAMGPRSRFHSRSLMTLVAGQVQKLGWNGCTGLDSQCHAELDFWNDNLRSLNGARIRVEGLVKDLDAKDLVSDAGDMLVGVTEFKDGVEDVSKRMQQPLLVDDLGESSTYRELRALEMAIEARGQSLAGQAVRWVTDSQSAVTILRVGSMKPRCHAVAVRVWGLVHSFGIALSCIWMPRTSTEIMVADDLSKNFDSSEYKLSRDDFSVLCQKFGPFCLDLFASPTSFLFKPFCSRFLCKDAVAVDAFTIDWGSLTNGFFHPPVEVVTRVLKHAQFVKAKGVLIVPVWESADFWPVIVRLVRNEQLIELSRFRPTLIAAQWLESNMFRGKSSFDFAAFQFRF